MHASYRYKLVHTEMSVNSKSNLNLRQELKYHAFLINFPEFKAYVIPCFNVKSKRFCSIPNPLIKSHGQTNDTKLF